MENNKSKNNIRDSKEGNNMKSDLLNENHSQNTNLNIKNNNSNCINEEDINKKNKEDSSIVINKNIISYNSCSRLNKIKNYPHEEKIKNMQSKQKSTTNFNPIRTSSIDEIKKFKTAIKRNLLNNKSKPNTKEPSDGESLKITKNIKFSSSEEKFILKNETKSHYKKSEKRCEFCENIFDDLESHYKICNKKSKSNIQGPRKRDTSLLDEKLNNDSCEEIGIGETKKKILLREFKLSFHAGNREYYNTNNISSNNPQINKGNIIKKNNKKKVEKLKIIKYNIPEDSKRILNSGNCKRLVSLKEKIIKDKGSKKNSITTKYGNVTFNNELINPLVYFSESKRKRKLNLK